MVSFVGDAIDLHVELAAGVRDAPGAWRFIRLFAARCASPVLGGDGFGAEELLAAEARLGFTLPAALRDFYAVAGKRNDLTRCQDRLLHPDQVYVDDAGAVLVFRWECQRVAEWGIPLSVIAELDPPVVFWLRSGDVWHPFLDRVSLACVEMVLSEWGFSGHAFGADLELDDDTVELLERWFRRLPMPDYPLWSWPGGRSTRWYAGLGAIAREDAGTWLRAGAIDAIPHAMPGEWLTHEE